MEPTRGPLPEPHPNIFMEALLYAETVNTPFILFYDKYRSCIYGVVYELTYSLEGVVDWSVRAVAAAGSVVRDYVADTASLVAARIKHSYAVVLVEPSRWRDLLELCGDAAKRLRYYRVAYALEEVLDILEELVGSLRS